jgi:hypothetical protein
MAKVEHGPLPRAVRRAVALLGGPTAMPDMTKRKNRKRIRRANLAMKRLYPLK